MKCFYYKIERKTVNKYHIYFIITNLYSIIILGEKMKKVLLCIMDGVGISESSKGNALKNANTKTLDKLFKK